MASILNSWPEWTRLYWLISLPLAAGLLWALYCSRQHTKDWRSILPVAFHAVLLKQHTTHQRTFGFVLLALAWLCALLAFLGPSWQTAQKQPSETLQQPALVIVMQLTPDVLASDLIPNRLQHIREKVIHLLKQREDSFSALVVYAGSAHTLVPLTNDLLTSKNLLQALHPDLMPTPGQRADLAVQRALELLQHGAHGQGEILLISNGISVNEQMAIQQLLKYQPTPLFLLGVGTLAGAPIITSTEGDLLTDASGVIIISRLNTTSLQLLSKQTASPYTALSNDQSDLQELGLLNQPNQHAQHARSGSDDAQQDQGYWLILPLLLLALSFARRGSVLLIPLGLLPMLPTPAYAFNFDDLWLRPDQQGQKLLAQQQPILAAQRFEDPAWRASAWYLAGDYQRAADAFALLDTAEAHYNRGNALALLGDFAEALDAYQQALQQAPDMLAAQYNSEIISEHLQRNATNAVPTTEQTEPEPSSTASAALPADTQKHSSNTTTAAELNTTAKRSDTPSSIDTQLTTSRNDAAQIGDNESEDKLIPHSTVQPNEDSLDLEGWLEQIPDDPSELLKRKFWYEQHQETQP